MPTRRHFLSSLTAAPFAPALFSAAAPSIAAALSRIPGAPDEIAGDEDFWSEVALAFTIDRSVINLNNGGVSPSPAIVQEAMKRHLDFSNTTPPPVSLWQVLEPQKEGVRQRLALHWGVDPEEIAITRNSSESLQICQLGIDLKAGDEVLCTTQDYPRMVTTFKQRVRREGITFRQFKLPIPAEDEDAIVRLYEENLADKTRLLLISHIINITGQIMPVKRIVALARSKNIPVIVDGAHALAHFAFKLSDLDCDYYGVSLHKWLAAPHGTGLLYVRKDKIKGLWPMMASPDTMDTDIRKFEEIGTHPAANFLAIGEALTFHEAIGDQRKEARLRYLKDWWLTRLLKNPRARSHTSLNPRFSCGIGNVQLEGIDTAKLGPWLWEKHKILATPIKHDEFEGLRVTPSVYTTMEELDRFCAAMEWVMASGLPA
jgi:selenocysteine lyase/cysteine desulfurase